MEGRPTNIDDLCECYWWLCEAAAEAPCDLDREGELVVRLPASELSRVLAELRDVPRSHPELAAECPGLDRAIERARPTVRPAQTGCGAAARTNRGRPLLVVVPVATLTRLIEALAPAVDRWALGIEQDEPE